MSRIILDTSSLRSLIEAQCESGVPARDAYAFQTSHGGVDAAIEALILYDEILVDGPSFERCIDAGEKGNELEDLCQPIRLSRESESEIYDKIMLGYVKHIEAPGEDFVDLFRMHTEGWMARELGVRYYPSCRWDDIEECLSGPAREVAGSLRAQLGPHVPMAGAACIMILRTLYYYHLQQMHSTDLVLHPLKGTHLVDTRPGQNILDMFDSTVRKAFYERKKKWLGRSDVSINIPMLTSFILNKCRSWEDLSSVIRDVRESKDARRFREGLNELLDAVRSHDNLRADSIFSELSAAADQWSRHLHVRPESSIGMSVPIPSKDLATSAADRDHADSPGDKLLVFLHHLVAKS